MEGAVSPSREVAKSEIKKCESGYGSLVPEET
jgi:hypothetical protein